MSRAWRLAAAATFAMLALQWSWIFGRPAGSMHYLAWSILLSLPLLPPALAFALRRPRAPLWAGIVALFYFCHGIAELRAAPEQAAWATAEIALAMAMVLAGSWPGLRAKLLKRRTAPPPNV